MVITPELFDRLLRTREEVGAAMNAAPNPTAPSVMALGKVFHALAAVVGYPEGEE